MNPASLVYKEDKKITPVKTAPSFPLLSNCSQSFNKNEIIKNPIITAKISNVRYKKPTGPNAVELFDILPVTVFETHHTPKSLTGLSGHKNLGTNNCAGIV